MKEKLIKIGSKVVSYGRYVTFLMAEVAISRQMFQELLRLIAELRPQLPTAPAETLDYHAFRRNQTGGACPSVSKNSPIRPSTSIRVTRGAGSGPHLAFVLREGRKNANIQANSAVIWRIPAYMSVKKSLRNLARRSIRLCATGAESELRDYRNVDLVLSAAVREPDALFHDPVAYVDFLRGCIQPARHSVTELKANSDSADIAAKRFNILVEELRAGLPTVAFSVAKELALIADKSRADLEFKMLPSRVADVGLFFSKSSSFGRKGRILFNLVRFMRSENCLELGTAVGMSALFILAALTAYAKSGHLATVEGDEFLFSISSSLLKQRYGEAVACHFGQTESILPALVKSLGTIDFMFHDCGHSRDQYIHDFSQVSEILAPGAVVLFDDIRWEHACFPSKGGARTHEGWQAVVGHHRVRRAVEIDDDLGLLLIGS